MISGQKSPKSAKSRGKRADIYACIYECQRVFRSPGVGAVMFALPKLNRSRVSSSRRRQCCLLALLVLVVFNPGRGGPKSCDFRHNVKNRGEKKIGDFKGLGLRGVRIRGFRGSLSVGTNTRRANITAPTPGLRKTRARTAYRGRAVSRGVPFRGVESASLRSSI